MSIMDHINVHSIAIQDLDIIGITNAISRAVYGNIANKTTRNHPADTPALWLRCHVDHMEIRTWTAKIVDLKSDRLPVGAELIAIGGTEVIELAKPLHRDQRIADRFTIWPESLIVHIDDVVGEEQREAAAEAEADIALLTEALSCRRDRRERRCGCGRAGCDDATCPERDDLPCQAAIAEMTDAEVERIIFELREIVAAAPPAVTAPGRDDPIPF